MPSTTRQSLGRRTRRVAVAGGLAITLAGSSLVGVAGASGAHDQSDGPERDGGPVNLIVCIASKGVAAPGAEGITAMWIDQVVVAARACGVELPEALIAEARRQAAAAEALRQCLVNAGVQRPADGQLPSPEAIAAFKAALVTCGIVPGGPPAAPQLAARPKVEQPKTPSAKNRQRAKTQRARASAARRGRR